MTEYKGFIERMARIFGVPRERRISDPELSDLGLSKADFIMLRSGVPNARERILSMACQFGLTEDNLDAHPELSLELAEKCGHCRQAKTCRDAIRSGDRLPQEKCPNSGLYAALSEV